MIESDPAAVRDIDAGDRVREALWDRVDRALSSPAPVERVCVSVEEPVDPLAFLRAQDARGGAADESPAEAPEAVYWSGRAGERAVAGYGTADVVGSAALPVDYGALRSRLARSLQAAGDAGETGGKSNGSFPAGTNGASDHAAAPRSPDAGGLRYYGGLRFDAAQPPAADRPGGGWGAFGSYRFVAPRFELIDGPAGVRLACTVVPGRDAARRGALREAVDRLVLPAGVDAEALPVPLSRSDVPGPGAWEGMVRRALSAFETDRLGKVVLARRVALAFERRLDPWLVLHHLRRETASSFHFGTRPAGGPAFVGASPERLFRRDGRFVQSEAVAGTCSRGDSAEADEALRTALLESDKDRREHAFVEEAIRDALEKVCTGTSAPEDATVMTLARGRHLHSEVEGTLRPDVSTVDLLAALHPTPAVGGVPTDAALATIRREEPFDRGWYAGPVGWIGRDAADFAVAIRSGLAAGDRFALFSGAGIVPGSDPDREWDEIEQKIGDFAAVLDLAGPSAA
jgi:menaquinone-specific isochorismate synthase